VVGYIALFCFVLGGTAIALPGHNRVDSGDIKRNAVRTSDIARRAVTAAKIAPRSVDGLRVIDNSLTGEDIDESTLNIRPAPNSIGPTELADRQRRLVFTPGQLVTGGGTAPESISVGPVPALSFSGSPGFASLATDVPGSRVEGTRMTVRVLWSATATGTVAWDMTYAVVSEGQNVEDALTPIEHEQSTSGGGDLRSASFGIPANALHDGQLLGVMVERNGADPDDTLTGDARLHLIEIDYMANG
jgi:hypothetical protein